MEEEGNPIICDLVTIPIDDAPEYAALGYEWGAQKRMLARFT
jgi:hypothetical protein